MENEEKKSPPGKKLRKITKGRLYNIALYYLQRFDSSVENLRSVLMRRVTEYAYYNPGYETGEARQWIAEILAEFERVGYLDDRRYAEIKIRNYLASGKPARYIKLKLAAKGVSEKLADELLQEEEYDSLSMAMKLARRKRIGPFRTDAEMRRQCRQKDLAALVRAGFEYETALSVIEAENPDEIA